MAGTLRVAPRGVPQPLRRILDATVNITAKLKGVVRPQAGGHAPPMGRSPWPIRMSNSRTRHSRDERRDEILRAVIDVCAEQGLARLSVSSVTAARRLHALAVLPLLPQQGGPPSKRPSSSPSTPLSTGCARGTASAYRAISRAALDGISALLKTLVVEEHPTSRAPLPPTATAVLYTAFCRPRGRALARALSARPPSVDFSRYHDVLIDHVYETFLRPHQRPHPLYPHAPRCRGKPSSRTIIASTLHIEGFTQKYPERPPRSAEVPREGRSPSPRTLVGRGNLFDDGLVALHEIGPFAPAHRAGAPHGPTVLIRPPPHASQYVRAGISSITSSQPRITSCLSHGPSASNPRGSAG